MATKQLNEKPAYEVYHNDQDRITYIKYRGHITGEMTEGVYTELWRLMENVTETLDNVDGCIFDFTEVISLDAEAMTAAAQKSIGFRMKMAHLVVNIPTAMVVRTKYQEVMVRNAMTLARQNEHPRFRLVKSFEEARQFFVEFRAQRQAQTAAAPGSTTN